MFNFCADFWCADFWADFCAHFCADFCCAKCRSLVRRILRRFSHRFSAEFFSTFWRFKNRCSRVKQKCAENLRKKNLLSRADSTSHNRRQAHVFKESMWPSTVASLGLKACLDLLQDFSKTKICEKSALQCTSLYFILYQIMSLHVQTKMWMQLICWGRAGGGCWTNPPLEYKQKKVCHALPVVVDACHVVLLHSDTEYYNKWNYITQPEGTPQPRTNATGKMVCSNSR